MDLSVETLAAEEGLEILLDIFPLLDCTVAGPRKLHAQQSLTPSLPSR
jgi:hypothetical protein